MNARSKEQALPPPPDEKEREALAAAQEQVEEAQRRLSEAERRLAEAERRVAELDAVLDAMPHAVYIGDHAGISRTNAEGLSMLGASSLADLQQRVGELGQKFRVRYGKDGELVPAEEQPFSRALAGAPAHLDTWATRLDTGEDVFIGGYSSPVILDGKTIGAVAVNVDLTHRVRIEEELKLADKRKDEFLAMLAHELRNPLAPIRNAAQILKLSAGDDQLVRQASEIIARQVQHMTELVDDLLDVSRVTRGLITLEMDVVDVRQVVTAAVEQVGALVESRRHRLKIEAREALFVCGDRTRLVQILTNLLTNAAKYTPDGGQITATVSATAGSVTLSVADNGIGIRPQLLPHVFEAFTQEERSSDRSQGGLGLGLALVRSLVGLHKGSVTAKSGGVGKGSEFTVVLPRAPAPTPQVESPADEIAPAPQRALDLLIVDDNVDAAESLAILLRAQGHHVQVEHRAQAALERAKAAPPRAVLLDIGLPDMDGYELARQLRALPHTRQVKLIALTGYGQAQDRKRSQAAGFDFHIVKPADAARIGALLVSLA